MRPLVCRLRHVLHLAFRQFVDRYGLDSTLYEKHVGENASSTHLVYFLRFEDVLQDLVVYQVLILVFRVHLYAGHRHITYPIGKQSHSIIRA